MSIRKKISPLQFSLASLLLVVACFAAILGWLRRWEPDPKFERNWSSLKVGMTETEVERLIGKPQFVLQDDVYVLYYYWQYNLAAGKSVEFRSGRISRIDDHIELAEPADGWSDQTPNMLTGRLWENW